MLIISIKSIASDFQYRPLDSESGIHVGTMRWPAIDEQSKINRNNFPYISTTTCNGYPMELPMRQFQCVPITYDHTKIEVSYPESDTKLSFLTPPLYALLIFLGT